MGWQDILKLTPKLKQLARDKDFTVTYLGDEAQMKEMWDASNPDSPHELRSSVPRFAKVKTLLMWAELKPLQGIQVKNTLRLLGKRLGVY